MAGTGAELDTGALRGLRFSCRPDCGLCCYATPAVTPVEGRRLLQVIPEAVFEAGDGGFDFVASRPDGGACQFLRANRCGVHRVRPFPCREYPLLVHVGTRVQATAVLTCPGVDLEGLGPATGGAPEAVGLEEELAAVRREMDRSPVDRWVEEGGRLWTTIRRRWVDPEPDLDGLRDRVRRGTLSDDDPAPLPGREEGLDSLPLVFVEGEGRIGLAGGDGRVDLVVIREEGGGDPAGSYPLPAAPPALDLDGRRRLNGYLDLWTRRDVFVWHRLAAGPSGVGSLAEDLAIDLGRISATVRERAWVLARARGSPSSALTAAEVGAGIRASDADLLDRPTLGRIL